MNDAYVEWLVAKKPNPLLPILKALCYIIAAVCLCIGMGSWIFLIPAAGFAVVAYMVIPMFDLEYEYTYFDKEITIDKIMAKEKRKRVRVVELGKVDVMAPNNSHELDSYRARKLPVADYSSRLAEPLNKPYTLVYNGEKGTELICIEPNDEMLKAIKTVMPRKVVEY